MKNTRIIRTFFAGLLAAALIVTPLGSVNAQAAAHKQSDPAASLAREQESALVALDAAEQGMVLLDNAQGVLPLAAKSGKKINVALFGCGVYDTVKGGTGSGDVYLKDGVNVTVLDAFTGAENVSGENALVKYESPFNVVNQKFLANEIKTEEAAKAANGGAGGMFASFFYTEDHVYPQATLDTIAKKTDTAIYVLSRNSGEGADRTAAKGDYFLNDFEYANLTELGKTFKNVVVVLNVGGVVDTNFYNGFAADTADNENNRNKIEGLDALVLMSQAGMEGGIALSELLSGAVNFSGKLTDTWPVNFSDNPSSAEFSLNDGVDTEEIYNDDIYVGYRYYDTFGKDVAYAFGSGQSYTSFSIKTKSVKADAEKVTVKVKVTNTGKVSGKEVVEVYFSAPAGKLEKPFQELATYAKTKELAPGKSQTLTLSFATEELSSYDENNEQYVIEAGKYVIRVGNGSRTTKAVKNLKVAKDVVTQKASVQLGVTKDMLQAGQTEGITVPDRTATYPSMFGGAPVDENAPKLDNTGKKLDIIDENTEGYRTFSSQLSTKAAKKTVALDLSGLKTKTTKYSEGKITSYVQEGTSYKKAKNAPVVGKETIKKVAAPAKSLTLLDVTAGKATLEELVANMSITELVDLVEGGSYAGLAASTVATAIIGGQADSVNGAAGETTANLYNSRLIPNIVLSDGPAGIRINSVYVDYPKALEYTAGETYYTAAYSWGGTIYTDAQIASKEQFDETLASGADLFTKGETYYQYCSAFPIGTMLAMTWDTKVIEAVGRQVGVEMLEYGVTSWLAPGMNIHRNALCGRNFEYFSEDPVVVGTTATAETKGVQTRADGTYAGIGVTIKHFAFNNQEADRMGSNSVVSERAAREIYLKGFQMAVESDTCPDYIMTAYNAVNGTSTFENYGLCTEMLVNEWGFDGFVMTDWYSIGKPIDTVDDSINVQAMLMFAGNDCEMPGSSEANLLAAYEAKTVRLGDIQRSAIHMLNVIMQSEVYRDTIETLLKSVNANAKVSYSKDGILTLNKAAQKAYAKYTK